MINNRRRTAGHTNAVGAPSPSRDLIACSGRQRALLGVAGATAALLTWAPTAPAEAVANPGQAVVNDYGQSIAEVNAEVAAAVSADKYVVAARAAYAAAHTATGVRRAAESKAKAVYNAAVKSKVRIRILRAQKAYLAAHAATVKAIAAETAARQRRDALVALKTKQTLAVHYRPVDGTFVGRLVSYLVPTVPFSFEPMQVQISVYGGHVSDVSVVAQAPAGSDSAPFNSMSLSTLMLETMTANDTSNVAAVSGASLSSEAFQQSLSSALVLAGFKG